MFFYRFIVTLLLPIWIIVIIYRLLCGKEVRDRLFERFAISNDMSSFRKKKVIWLHAASVGESLVMLTMVNNLADKYKEYCFLLTTCTVTAAEIVQNRLPSNAIHQFIPIDEYFCVKRFFKRWKPSLGIIVESEIWPNLIDIGSQYCPMMLVNATMSDKSYNRWKFFSGAAQKVLNKFAAILCQNENIESKYKSLCDAPEIKSCGNIKFSTNKPFVDTSVLAVLNNEIGDRIVVLAASTHPGDEEIICSLHKKLKDTHPSLLTIIVPRHPARIDDVSKLFMSEEIKFTTRSKGEGPLYEVYIADTLGELGLFFSIAKITIICGSFKHGGHNIIEPAFFDTTILFGPDMRNSEDIAKEFVDSKAAIQISDLNALVSTTQDILSDKIGVLLMQKNAKLLLEKYKYIVDSYQNIIERYIT